MTPAELQAVSALKAHERDFREVLRKYRTRKSELEAEVLRVRGKADESVRRLLTHQRHELVDAVADALQLLGFKVEKIDETLAESSAKLEDLRVYAPDDSWEALCEVRGYTRGAQLNDLLRVTRFVSRFALEQRRPPASTWYIVNQFLDQDPDTRRPPLAGHPEEVRTFAEGGGLVIDTRELFKLWRAVAEGSASPEDARRKLMIASGTFVMQVA
jgi:hypothetical protein